MPDSHRKKRQRRRQSPEDALIESLEDLVRTKPGVALEAHPSLTFETLGFEVTTPTELEEGELVALINQLLDTAESAAINDESSWTWMISIDRGNEQVTVIEPGHAPYLACPLCRRIQQANTDRQCCDCFSPLPDVA